METTLFVILGLVAFLVLVDLGAYVYGAKVMGLGWRWPLRIFRRPSAPIALVSNSDPDPYGLFVRNEEDHDRCCDCVECNTGAHN